KQVISLYKRLNSTGTEALATELKLRQGFNDARIVNIMSDLRKIDNIKKIWKFNLTCLVLLKAEELKFYFNFSFELWQIEQDETPLNIVLGKGFNRKTADALKRLNLFTIAQLISKKPEWFIALENCLIGNRRNRKLVPEYIISGYNSLALSIELPAVSLDKRKKELVLVENKDNDKKIFIIVQKGKAKILECLEIELLKKQKLSKALELLQKENQIGSLTKMGLGWLQLSEDKSYIVDEDFARIRDSLAAINAITSINCFLAFSQFIKLGNFSIVSKIRDLVRLKEVCLNLVKVKGHSENHWNRRADTLAKKGLTAREKLLVVPT
ncbi:11419_t:CDS:2, partial [Gigaspora margarita]